ncbi:hypothetical protein TGRH88_049750 [Toxoplasma gondii]|uniref:Transmembrane protein n=1 Tax=Toxoplasma gondii TaxID=5811 RepID=A0A7J6JVK1_TOXGO|nr:hypothetical protein TGRH88_049750 [Toxoplasma gondii]
MERVFCGQTMFLSVRRDEECKPRKLTSWSSFHVSARVSSRHGFPAIDLAGLLQSPFFLGGPELIVPFRMWPREKGEKLKLNAAQQLRAAAVVEAVFAQLAQFHPDAYESANVRGLIKWWDDPYIIILLCLMFGGLVSMGIWCLVASYR